MLSAFFHHPEAPGFLKEMRNKKKSELCMKLWLSAGGGRKRQMQSRCIKTGHNFILQAWQSKPSKHN